MVQRPRTRASLVAAYPSVFNGGGAPVNLTPPTISGTAQVGATLARVNGTWAGSGIAYAHQWLAGGVAIAGATAATYTPVAADLGKTIAVSTTATNVSGAVTVTSAATAAVAAAAAPSGFTYLTDPDGSRLTDADGAYLMEAA